MFTKAAGILDDFRAPRLKRFCNGFQDTTKPWPSVAIIRRKVGTAKDRLARWKQKHSHRPTAASCHDLNGGHIDLIKIRAFFAIDFDVYEVAIHDFRDRCVFERLVLHHMTPMTG